MSSPPGTHPACELVPLGPEDLPDVLACQASAVADLEDPEDFLPSSPQRASDLLAIGRSIGARNPDGSLAALMLVQDYVAAHPDIQGIVRDRCSPIAAVEQIEVIDTVVVAPPERGRGLQVVLGNEVLARAVERQVAGHVASVAPANRASRTGFERLGFEPIARASIYHGVDRLIVWRAMAAPYAPG